MERITVKAKVDGGIHLKYGEIRKGQSYTIDPADFGSELFERPEGFESPHEKADRERTEAAAPSVPEVPKIPEIASTEAPLKKGGK